MLKKYWIIFLLTFVNALSFTILIPVLPFVVREFWQPEIVLGILFATFSFFQFIAAPLLGALSDKYGRKPILLITQFWTLLSWIILGIAYMLPEIQLFGYILLPIFVIFISRMFDGITWWNVSVAQAMIADITERKDRSKIFGINGAVFGFSLIIGPAIGSLSLSFSYWFLGSAMIGGSISFITLCIMFFALTETLREDKRKTETIIQFKSLNVMSSIKKWSGVGLIKFTLVMKLFAYSAFIIYTTISALYLIDVFGFSADKVWYYLTFTGSFLVLHQWVSIPTLAKKFNDLLLFRIGIILMSISFFGMGLAGDNIIIFTGVYFFWVLWISASLTAIGAITSNSVDEKNQWEVLWMTSGVESLIAIVIPIVATLMYASFDFSIYFVVSFLAFVAFLVNILYFKNIEESTL